MYRRHPWLLDVPATGNLPGPNAVAFIERSLAALAGTDLTGPAKLETVGLFSGVVRLFAQTEIGQQRAGQDDRPVAGIAGRYLLQIAAAAGQHPHLAAALAGEPADPADQPAAPAGQPPATAVRRAGAAVQPGDDPHPDRPAPACRGPAPLTGP